jgi:hypothetical protein
LKLQVDGKWPYSEEDYNRLIEGIRKHFASFDRRLRLLLSHGFLPYVFAVEQKGKYVLLKVSIDSPLLTTILASSYLDAVLEHERKHLDLTHEWKFVALKPPRYVYEIVGPEEYARVGYFMTSMLQDEISEVYAVGRMSDANSKKYVEYLNLELQRSWNRLVGITFSGTYPKMLWMLPMARQDFLCKKCSVASSSVSQAVRASTNHGESDQTTYNYVERLFEEVWAQAKSASGIISIEKETRDLYDSLFAERDFYIPKCR